MENILTITQRSTGVEDKGIEKELALYIYTLINSYPDYIAKSYTSPFRNCVTLLNKSFSL